MSPPPWLLVGLLLWVMAALGYIWLAAAAVTG